MFLILKFGLIFLWMITTFKATSENWQKQTIGGWIAFLNFHDTYGSFWWDSYRRWDLKVQYQYYLMKQTQTEMDGWAYRSSKSYYTRPVLDLGLTTTILITDIDPVSLWKQLYVKEHMLLLTQTKVRFVFIKTTSHGVSFALVWQSKSESRTIQNLLSDEFQGSYLKQQHRNQLNVSLERVPEWVSMEREVSS
jgi:hypothetical protein